MTNLRTHDGITGLPSRQPVPAVARRLRAPFLLALLASGATAGGRGPCMVLTASDGGTMVEALRDMPHCLRVESTTRVVS